MEIQSRQLIDDNADWYVLTLTSIDTSNETIKNQSIQGSDDTLHLRVVGNKQITWMLRITHLQVKVITIFMENPIGFFGGKTRCIDAKRTNHTFQLFHSLILHGCLERTKQRCYLWVSFQHFKDGLIIEIEERQDMWHIAVLA